MDRVRRYIEAKQAEFSKHLFFRHLSEDLPVARVAGFVPQVTFFIFAFQDIVQMIAGGASDPRLRGLLRRHGEEEVGHDRWFLRDLHKLAGGPPTVEAIFGPDHAPTRRATYAMAAEALTASSDVERLCLILAMEATAEVSFGAAQAYFQRMGAADGLLFFAGPHLASEEQHSLFEDEGQEILGRTAVDDIAYERIRSLVDRVFAAFGTMLDGLAVTIGSTRES